MTNMGHANFLKEIKEDRHEFPLSLQGRGVSEKIAAACFIHEYFLKESLHEQRMNEMTASTLSSSDDTFKVESG